MNYVNNLLVLIDALNKKGVEYILIGGAALNLHGLVRATEDIDIFIDPTEQNVENLKKALRSLWNDPDISEISYDDLRGDYPAIRYGPPEGEIYLDILTRLGEETLYHDLEWEEIEVRGTIIRVASAKTLFHMKKNTVRLIDQADAIALKQAFDFEDNDAD